MLFQTGWFVESITTQVLVVFASRTKRRFFRSRPHKLLVATAVGSVTAAIVFPFLSVSRWFNLVAPPPLFFVFLVCATGAYLGLVEATKGFFYRSTDTAT
jgi:Mg2+-importing ATPase